MNTTTLIQIPVSKALRDRALVAAEKQGFSSLQDFIRLVLSKLVHNQIAVNVGEPIIELSAKNDRRYARMLADIKSGKVKTKNFEDTSSLIDYLNE